MPGAPMGAPRQTQRDRWKKRPVVVKYHAWRDHLRLCVRQQIDKLPPAEKVTKLNWLAVFEPPPSWSKKKRAAAIGQLHRSKPDRDNIDKACLDSLYDEDSFIAAGTVKKVWGDQAKLIIEIHFETEG